MTLMILAAVALLMGAGSGNVWAQETLQVNADAPQVTQNFDGMWDAATGAATLNMPQGKHCDKAMAPKHECKDHKDGQACNKPVDQQCPDCKDKAKKN